MVFVPFLCLFAVLALFLVRLGDHLAHVGTIGHKHAHTHTHELLCSGVTKHGSRKWMPAVLASKTLLWRWT